MSGVVPSQTLHSDKCPFLFCPSSHYPSNVWMWQLVIVRLILQPSGTPRMTRMWATKAPWSSGLGIYISFRKHPTLQLLSFLEVESQGGEGSLCNSDISWLQNNLFLLFGLSRLLQLETQIRLDYKSYIMDSNYTTQMVLNTF